MIEHQVVKQETISEDGVERHDTLRTDVVANAPHSDEMAGGALAGGVVGAVVGAVVGGPVGAVVGGAIGAASGATVGAVDTRVKSDTVVVTHEERGL